MTFPILTLIMLSPFVGAGVILLIPKDRHEAIKVVAPMAASQDMWSWMETFIKGKVASGFNGNATEVFDSL